MTLDPSRSPTHPRRLNPLAQAHRLRGLLMVLLVAVATLSAWFGSGIWAQKEVVVRVDGEERPFTTSAVTVAQALAAAGLEPGPHDLVTPSLDEPVADGLLIDITRAVPIVIAVDGREVRILSAAATVGNALAGCRLPFGPDDRVEPGPEQPLTPGLEVTVTRVLHTYQHRDDPIPFETIYRDDMSMNLGTSEVDQAGEEGILRRLLGLTYEDGELVDTVELEVVTAKEPVNAVVRVGTAGDIARGGETIHFLKALSVSATAYDPGPISCGPSADGLTCLGLRATKGIIAVDPNVIPLWTEVYVDGYGFAVAGDTGSAIKGNKIDVCFDTYDEAINWGVKKTKVYILKLPGGV